MFNKFNYKSFNHLKNKETIKKNYQISKLGGFSNYGLT